MREAGLRGRIGDVKRSLYNEDHVAFADSFRRFVAQEITPDYLKWEAEGIAPRSLYKKAGDNGFIGMAIPQEFGGGGSHDFRFNSVIAEELA